MNKGKVIFYNSKKGIGYIKDSISAKEYFFQFSGLKNTINLYDEVIFDLQKGKKGLNAVNIKHT